VRETEGQRVREKKRERKESQRVCERENEYSVSLFALIRLKLVSLMIEWIFFFTHPTMIM